jgi:DNA polymerase-3 subunit epsilon
MVAGCPTYGDIASTIDKLIDDAVVVTHTHFDRVAMYQASRLWAVDPPRCTWLDTARVARRTWEECARSGYGLADVCELIGYNFHHHNALEDAKAAGRVLIAAMEHTSLSLEGFLKRVRQPIDPTRRREGNPEGPLFGEVVVFTGALNILRREAADLAASAGCRVEPGVTKKTTLLVVGDIDVKKLARHEKSAKHRKAESLIKKGIPIRIIRETDFRELVASG